MPGRPMKPPQMFGTSIQSVLVCGLIPMRRPMTEPSATIAATAT